MIPEVEERITNLKTKISGLKGDLEQAEKELIQAYEDRFPIGRFYLIRNKHWNRHNRSETKISYEIHWQKSYKIKVGLTSQKSDYNEQKEVDGFPGIYYTRSYGRPRGWKTTQYESLEKMLLATQKFMFPINLVEAFVMQYVKMKEKANAAG
jgi:hypothetical protein